VKALVIILIVAVVVPIRVYMRIRRKKRGQAERTSDRQRGDVELIARREIKERVTTRAFKMATLIVLLVVAAAIIIPVVRRGHQTTVRIGVVGTIAAPLRYTAQQAANADGASVRLISEPTIHAATKALSAGRLDLVVEGATKLVVDRPIAAGDTSATAFVAETLSRSLSLEAELVHAGLSPRQASQLARPITLPVTSLKPASNHSTNTVAEVYILIITYVLLTQYGMWILLGVVEEKSNRIVEVLLSAVTPIRLLVGKVTGIGLLALAQAAIIIAFALVLAASTGSDLLKGTAPSGLVVGLVWLLLGYAFYCWLYAAVGSLVDRQDQVQSVALPVQLPILFGYIVSLTALGSSNPSLFIKVLAYVPPTAPFAMPVLVSDGVVSWWQVVIAAIISLGATAALAQLASRIYARAILKTGRRIHLKELLGPERTSQVSGPSPAT